MLLDAPRPEHVPRGLALAVGEKYAVRLLRVIARRTIESVESLGFEPVIWFAPAEAPRIVIAVLVEQAGRGAEVAAPIGGDLMTMYLRSAP